jgi:hypothetical protein
LMQIWSHGRPLVDSILEYMCTLEQVLGLGMVSQVTGAIT